jgi:hypothetical protein
LVVAIWRERDVQSETVVPKSGCDVREAKKRRAQRAAADVAAKTRERETEEHERQNARFKPSPGDY